MANATPQPSVSAPVRQNLWDYLDDITWCTCNLERPIPFPPIALLVATHLAPTELTIDDVDFAGRIADALRDILNAPDNADITSRIAQRLGLYDSVPTPAPKDPIATLFAAWPHGRVLAALLACCEGLRAGIGLVAVRPGERDVLIRAVSDGDRRWIEDNAILRPPGCLSDHELREAERRFHAGNRSGH